MGGFFLDDLLFGEPFDSSSTEVESVGGAVLWVQEQELAELLPEVLQASRAVVAERMGQFPLVVKEQGQEQEVVGLAWQMVKEGPAGLGEGYLMLEPEWEQG